jgi:hypothetical protein
MAYAHAHRGALPNFIIIGTQKGGTTSLYGYLRQHPDVLPCAHKEVNFFDLNYKKGSDWYRRLFLDPDSLELRYNDRRIVVGEATPYYLFHPWCAQRIWQTAPETKLIVLVRHPIARAFSQYQHNIRKGREGLSFADALERERILFPAELTRLRSDPEFWSEFHHSFAYANRSCYASQIEEYLKYFSKDQILFLESDELFNQPAVTYQRTLEFLNLRPFGLKDKRPLNVGNYDHTSIPCYEELRRYFAPHNQQLYDMLGVDFGW